DKATGAARRRSSEYSSRSAPGVPRHDQSRPLRRDVLHSRCKGREAAYPARDGVRLRSEVGVALLMREEPERTGLLFLVRDHEANRVVEVDSFLLAPEMHYAPEPVFFAGLATVFHYQPRHRRRLIRIHSQAPVRGRIAKALECIGAVYIVV